MDRPIVQLPQLCVGQYSAAAAVVCLWRVRCHGSQVNKTAQVAADERALCTVAVIRPT